MTSLSRTEPSRSVPTASRWLTNRWLLAVAPLAFVLALVGLPARATYGARTTADEPQYLLTAESLAEDFDLDISDELREQSYRPYHEIALSQQTFDLDESGRQVSPHDPLLPILLALPMAMSGWVGAKVALAAMAAMTAMLTAVIAHRRCQVAPSTAAIATVVCFAGLPLAGYGTQIYPEMPAALVTLVMVAGLTAPSSDRRSVALVLAMLVALPWLAVKYVPVAAVGGIALLWRVRHRPWWLAWTMIGAVVGAITYLLAHQWIYGGWTVYAAGDHFVTTGEFSVVGTNVNVVGRSRRLVGLLVDRHFGLAAWSPVWFLLPIATLRAARATSRAGNSPLATRPPANRLLVSLLVVTWLNATFVALTMHGWWVPGRQLVVSLPIAVILLAQWADGARHRIRIMALLGTLGFCNWLWLAVEASTGRRTFVVDFTDTASWPHRAVALLLPDGLVGGTGNDLLLAGWAVVIVVSTGLLHRGRADNLDSEAY